MKKLNIILITVCLLAAVSCGEEVLEKTNKNNVTVDSYYKTQQEIEAALNGVYAQLQGGQLAGNETTEHRRHPVRPRLVGEYE